MASRYRQEVQKYGKKDTIIAISVYLFYIVIINVSFLALDAIRDIFTFQQQNLLLGIFYLLASAIPIIVVILIKKQGLASIGIHKEKLWRALRLGLIFSIIPIALGIFAGLFNQWEFVGFDTLLFNMLLLLIMAASEDILMVGFLQTRLYGVFKTDRSAICVGAALFSLMHVPSWARGLVLDDLVFFILMVVVWFVAHIIFVAIFKKHFSLFPVTLLHTLINLLPYAFWILTDDIALDTSVWAIAVTFILAIAVGIWAISNRNRMK